MNTDSPSPPVLFLSGAGLPAWIWDRTRSALPIETTVATYPKRADATLRDITAEVLAQAPSGAFTIVAHSIGGVVASQIAATAPERVAGLLGIAASFPAARTSFLAASPAPQRVLLGLIMRIAGTRPPEKAIRSVLCAGLGQDDTARIIADFVPESAHLYRDAVPPRTFPERRGYVVTTADRQLSAAQQHQHANELGPGLRRGLPTGHLPMLQDPASLAEIIHEFATID
ncbi:alpha/beta hydrolase [Nocardia sp. 2]|uniref:Alpha/beta hydrolase n=1 Tax=Nocardia acididurans TaxID=2802282 RepID=A0ABS1MIB4_9NOCA|nr:alpha/beta hydrolase [Nocardia acididurans]MBL1080044.1 alpha/beta hydrolase [Nocardia acididurans]